MMTRSGESFCFEVLPLVTFIPSDWMSSATGSGAVEVIPPININDESMVA
jgi:hypothetical protein